jgi:phospholipase/carboxylesterase
MMTKSHPPSPLVFVPSQGKPLQCFVLLHGESANPQQLFSLADAIKLNFPQALVFLPYAPFFKGHHEGERIYQWVDPAVSEQEGYAAHIRQSLPVLLSQILHIQNQFGLTGQQTALAGFAQGATVALEACLFKPDLAGRVLAFAGQFASLPTEAPPATMLHFLHGADDERIPVNQVRNTLSVLGDSQADVTLDIASKVGHCLHDALIKQAMVRLKTCVPLRSWEAALNALQGQEGPAGDQERTLH